MSRLVPDHSSLLGDCFFDSAERFADRTALVVDKHQYSYSELSIAAKATAAVLGSNLPERVQLVALFGQRSAASYAGVLGILAAGRGYVPLNPKFPVGRNLQVLDNSGVRAIVVDMGFLESFAPLLEAVESSLTIFCLRLGRAQVDVQLPARHEVFWVDCAATEYDVVARAASTDDVAYLLYTSGSTGVPKGVRITHRSASAYVERIRERYDFSPDDRFSQCFDLSFDLSVHDMFVCWGVGACLYCLPDTATLGPTKFILNNCLTVWFSVPSTIAMCQKLRILKPGTLTSLRISLFCGEPLLVASAEAWTKAAPNSSIDNLYGPTEATISFTGYTFRSGTPVAAHEVGIVPIGEPFPGLGCVLLGKDLKPVQTGEIGELCLGGDQLSLGYWKDSGKTKKSFLNISIPEHPLIDRWYRTGDLARYTAEQGYMWIGRIDSQIKLLGHRVELSEIEHHLRNAAESNLSVAVDWPRTESGASGIVGFVSGSDISSEKILRRCREAMPSYMVPRAIQHIDNFPLNANGKVDRGQLRAMLEQGSSDAQ